MKEREGGGRNFLKGVCWGKIIERWEREGVLRGVKLPESGGTVKFYDNLVF